MMQALTLRPIESCHWDLVSLGEVMLRFDPGEDRIHTARNFRVWEGGGEYNVARSLRRCFSLRTAIATALADNLIGRLAEDLMLQGGVDLSLLQWKPYDGVGRKVRNGLNFVERGFGARPPLGCSDRGHTAVAQLTSDSFDWHRIFVDQGARVFHTGGIFAALSPTTPLVAETAIDAAIEAGTIVSYDLNYRDSLWRAFGGNARAREVNSGLVRKVHILFAGEHDFQDRLGVDLAGISPVPELVSELVPELQASRSETILRRVASHYPNLHAVVMTERRATSSCSHYWGASALVAGSFVRVDASAVDVLDRIGCGDSFAAGFLYGLLAGRSPEWALGCGVAHGALAMSTPGDTSTASLAEVERLMSSKVIHTQR